MTIETTLLGIQGLIDIANAEIAGLERLIEARDDVIARSEAIEAEFIALRKPSAKATGAFIRALEDLNASSDVLAVEFRQRAQRLDLIQGMAKREQDRVKAALK